MRTPCWQEAAGTQSEDAVCLEITNSRLFIFSVFRSECPVKQSKANANSTITLGSKESQNKTKQNKTRWAFQGWWTGFLDSTPDHLTIWRKGHGTLDGTRGRQVGGEVAMVTSRVRDHEIKYRCWLLRMRRERKMGERGCSSQRQMCGLSVGAAWGNKTTSNLVSHKHRKFLEKFKMTTDLESGVNTFFIPSCGGQGTICLGHFYKGPIPHYPCCRVDKDQMLQLWSPQWCHRGQKGGVL